MLLSVFVELSGLPGRRKKSLVAPDGPHWEEVYVVDPDVSFHQNTHRLLHPSCGSASSSDENIKGISHYYWSDSAGASRVYLSESEMLMGFLSCMTFQQLKICDEPIPSNVKTIDDAIECYYRRAKFTQKDRQQCFDFYSPY